MPETDPNLIVPRRKLVVSDEAVPFISRGGRVFSKHVIESDLGIESGDIVQVVDRNNRFITYVQADFPN